MMAKNYTTKRTSLAMLWSWC